MQSTALSNRFGSLLTQDALLTALQDYDNNKSFFETMPDSVISLRKLAQKNILNHYDQLEILKILVADENHDGKAYQTLIHSLTQIESIQAIIALLPKSGSTNKNKLQKKEKTEHLLCLIVQLWNYELLDEENYQIVYKACRDNIANGAEWAKDLSKQLIGHALKKANISSNSDSLVITKIGVYPLTSGNMDEDHTVFKIKLIQLFQAASLLTEKLAHSILKGNFYYSDFISLVTTYHKNKLLNENNAIKLFEFHKNNVDVEQFNQVITTLSHRDFLNQGLTSQSLIDTVLAQNINEEIIKFLNLKLPFALTATLLQAIIQSGKISKITSIAQKLVRKSLLTQARLERLTKIEPKFLIIYKDNIEKLDQADFLNDASVDLLLQATHANNSRLNHCIPRFEKEFLLNIANLKAVIASHFENDDLREHFVDAMIVLNKNKLLNAKTRELISHSSHPVSLANALILLFSNDIPLTDINLAKIMQPDYNPSYENVLLLLSKHKRLNKTNFDKIFSHENKELLIQEILEYANARNIPQILLNILIDSENLQQTADTLKYLRRAALLNGNLPTFHYHLHESELCYALLSIAALNFTINQLQLDNIFRFAHILGHNQGDLFSTIPAHIFNNKLLDSIFLICAENDDNIPNAMVALETCITRALEVHERRERFIRGMARMLRGQNAFQEILFGLLNGQPGDLGNNVANDQNPVLNRPQSTHTASVHKSVSESAIRLKDLYGKYFENSGKKEISKQIVDYVQQLPGDKSILVDENAAAKRAIGTFNNDFWKFTDPASQVSILEMLYLAWIAIHDEQKRVPDCSLEDAKKRFVRGLYEIQRGYNLDESGEIDDGENDKVICTGGGFNKVVESVNTVHPDVVIEFITKEGLIIKLRNTPIITDYVLQDLDIANLAAEQLFQLFNEIDDDPIESDMLKQSWGRAKIRVANEFSEYKVAFKNDRDDKNYNDCIDVTGMWSIDSDRIIEAINLATPCIPSVSKLKQLNTDYLAAKKTAYEKESAEWPILFGFFGWKNTFTWQSIVKDKRNAAFDTLITELQTLKEDKDKLAIINYALKLPLFTDHRSNYFYMAGDDTHTAGLIKKLIETVSKHQNNLEIEDKHQIYNRRVG